MSQMIKIKQSEWDLPFLNMVRNDELSFYVDLYSLYKRSHILDQQIRTCKYCKAFPFTISEPLRQIQTRNCEMCGSINEYQMCWQLIQKGQELPCFNNSYIVPTQNDVLRSMTLILFIESLEEGYLQLFIEALKFISTVFSVQAIILLVVKGRLAVIDFVDQPELIILSKDIDIREIIDDKKCVLTEVMIEELEKILQTISNESIKKVNQPIYFDILREIALNFNEKAPHRVDILLWIGKVPAQVKLLPQCTLNIIAILIVERNAPNANKMIQLREMFSEVHFLLQGHKAPTQLYYLLHKVISEQHLGIIIPGVPILRTNQQYSGNLVAVPKKFINSSAPFAQVKVASSSRHKIQINVEYVNLSGQNLKLVANCTEQQKRRKLVWFQRTILISRALNHVLKTYLALKKGKEEQKYDMDYFFIRSELQKFGNTYENQTKLYQQILQHMMSYFKEFQKSAIKLYQPFKLIKRKELLFVFYPLWQGGIMHSVDFMWVDSQGESNVEWCNEILGVAWTRRLSHLPVFYQLCIDNEAYSFIEQ